MTPIYQTMTGEVQCIMHEGVLMVREWPEEIQHKGPNPHPWIPCPLSLDDLERDAKADLPHRQGWRARCMLHCLQQTRPSSWYVQPRSERLTDEIESLMRQREESIAQEIADRPSAASPKEEDEGGE